MKNSLLCLYAATLFLSGLNASAQTYAELTGNNYSSWKNTYDFNLRACADIKKQPQVHLEALVLENTLVLTKARVMISDKFVPKSYQVKFTQILEARKKAIGNSSDTSQVDPNKYMKKFDFYGYCMCRNDVSKFVPNESVYKSIAALEMQQIEEAQEIKCLVDHSTL